MKQDSQETLMQVHNIPSPTDNVQVKITKGSDETSLEVDDESVAATVKIIKATTVKNPDMSV